MSAAQALTYLREHGVEVELDGADLLLDGAEALSEKTIARLRELKGEIVAELSRPPKGRAGEAENGYGLVRAALTDSRGASPTCPAEMKRHYSRAGKCAAESCGDVNSMGWPAHGGRYRWRWLCSSCAPTAGRAMTRLSPLRSCEPHAPCLGGPGDGSPLPRAFIANLSATLRRDASSRRGAPSSALVAALEKGRRRLR